jgi:hypothetical protein
MTNINQLTAVDTLSGGDAVPIWSQGQGDTRRTSMTTIAAYIAEQTATLPPVRQYAAPVTGATVTVGQPNPTWLVLTGTGTLADLTISLGLDPADLQEVTVSATGQITALTVSGTAPVLNAPTSIVAGGWFSMRYDAATPAWRRVG